jgi:hypothetical protein
MLKVCEWTIWQSPEMSTGTNGLTTLGSHGSACPYCDLSILSSSFRTRKLQFLLLPFTTFFPDTILTHASSYIDYDILPSTFFPDLIRDRISASPICRKAIWLENSRLRRKYRNHCSLEHTDTTSYEAWPTMLRPSKSWVPTFILS